MNESKLDSVSVPDYAARTSLRGKHAIVLGGGNGIGRQASHMLCQFGATVSVVDINEELAQQVAQEIDADAWRADVTSAEDTERLFRDIIAKHDTIDVIVDIVGMSMFAYIEDMEAADWQRMQDINLTQAFNVLRGAKRVLRDHGNQPCSIVFVSSVSGYRAAQRHAAYGAAKAGLIALIKSAAVEFGPAGVRVNSVAPGITWTGRIGGALGEERYDQFAGPTPLGRLGKTQDIASALHFFASDLSSFVTGQTLVVDGGRQARFEYDVEAI